MSVAYSFLQLRTNVNCKQQRQAFDMAQQDQLFPDEVETPLNIPRALGCKVPRTQELQVCSCVFLVLLSLLFVGIGLCVAAAAAVAAIGYIAAVVVDCNLVCVSITN